MERKSVMGKATFFALVLIVEALPAQAYLLPAEPILAAVARRRADIGFNTIVAEGTFQRGEGAPALQVWEGIRAGRAHRIERRDGANTEVVLTIPGKRWMFKAGDRAPAPQKSAG